LNQRLGVCVVGAGERGTQHAHAWSKIGSVDLISVADVNPLRARRLAKDLKFKFWSTDFESAILREGVNVVSICTPAFYHPEIAIFAASHGKHILCEKPIALTIEDAERMIHTARTNKVKLCIGFQRRYSRYFEVLADLISDGEIGRPVMYRLESAVEIRPKKAMHDMKRGNAGPIVDGCCHFFDLWRLIFHSEPKEVIAKGFVFARDREELQDIEELAPDTAAIIVEFVSGDLGVITISWGLPPGVRGRSGSDVLGPEGVILLEKESMTIIKEGGNVRRVGPFVEDALLNEVQDFIDCVLTGREPKATGEDGLVALKVSLAALESMFSGKPVKVTT